MQLRVAKVENLLSSRTSSKAEAAQSLCVGLWLKNVRTNRSGIVLLTKELNGSKVKSRSTQVKMKMYGEVQLLNSRRQASSTGRTTHQKLVLEH
jgi:hypothetical protein